MASRRGRLRLGCASAFLALLTASCVGAGDRSWGSQNIAIWLLHGRPTLILYTCLGGKSITSVTVVKHDIHADTDKILWQVARAPLASAAGERVETITIGQSATGFRTVTPLQGGLPRSSLDVTLARGHAEGVVNFDTSQLSATTLRVDRSWFGGKRSVELDEFMRVNRKNC